jgi:hypothetical protein
MRLVVRLRKELIANLLRYCRSVLVDDAAYNYFDVVCCLSEIRQVVMRDRDHFLNSFLDFIHFASVNRASIIRLVLGLVGGRGGDAAA